MDNSQPYETLDPENWEEMHLLAHRMVDDAISYLETARERPVWQRQEGFDLLGQELVPQFN